MVGSLEEESERASLSLVRQVLVRLESVGQCLRVQRDNLIIGRVPVWLRSVFWFTVLGKGDVCFAIRCSGIFWILCAVIGEGCDELPYLSGALEMFLLCRVLGPNKPGTRLQVLTSAAVCKPVVWPVKSGPEESKYLKQVPSAVEREAPGFK